MSSNRILSRLSRQDFALLEPHLEAVDLPVQEDARNPQEAHRPRLLHRIRLCVRRRQRHEQAQHRGRHHRPRRHDRLGNRAGTAIGPNTRPTSKSPARACASVRPVCGRRTSAAIRLHRAMLRYAHAFLAQTTTTALANGRSKIEERLARWLLMADDRIDGDELPLTHEFLGLMLGTHRPGVTIALQALEKSGPHHHPPQPHHHRRSQSVGEKLQRHLRALRRLRLRV